MECPKPEDVVANLADKFLNCRWSELMDDFSAPLPVYCKGKVHVLKTPSEIGRALYRLRCGAEDIGMNDFRGQLSEFSITKPGVCRMTVDWTYLTPDPTNDRRTVATYFLALRGDKVRIEMVEIDAPHHARDKSKAMRFDLADKICANWQHIERQANTETSLVH